MPRRILGQPEIEPHAWRFTCGLKGTLTFAAARGDTVTDVGVPASELTPIPWQRVVTFTAGAMALASIHRVTFSVLAVPFAEEFSLSMPQVGLLQSAVLCGYMFGQVPAGIIADQLGGIKVMTVGLVLWCLTTGVTPFVCILQPGAIFAGILVARASLGFAQSCVLPAASATVAMWVPEENRSRALAKIHCAYNIGNIIALCVTPLLIKQVGWPWTLRFFSAAGLAWAAWAIVAVNGRSPPSQSAQALHNSAASTGQSSDKGQGQSSNKGQGTSWGPLMFLCWSHIVISYGFFVFQSFIPSYLHHKGLTDLRVMGALSALPWGAAALVALMVGNLADWLHSAKGWKLVRVRLVMQAVASIGPALALMPLVVAQQHIQVPAAVTCLTAAVGLQAFCYAGFHAYIQDVAPADAGKVLGLTNSCGTVAGVLANVVAGRLAAVHNGYALLFASIVGLYLISAVTWGIFANGEDVYFPVGRSA
ncbi:hypothetical protein WJX73_001410 [Symbiochloris irregularis]|uniref:Major facilitator superfamily (MFS) profile domain-containing protein n=1 Tax=Symbiochloris irregularis TaxID=706552 RepID=A0AAW1NQN9_9CHLO